MKPLRLEPRTYFDIGNAINPNCLKIMPLEPKRKLQKCNNVTLKLYSCCWYSVKFTVLGMQKGRNDIRNKD
jgi:hypothetical protein